jgi:thiol-disulfide isomerase/thioredoxin
MAAQVGTSSDLWTDVRNGNSVGLNLENLDSPSVFVFLSTECPCSRSHAEILQELSREYGDKGFHFFGVHSLAKENTAEDDSYFQGGAWPFPILRDHDLKIANHFKAVKTPQVFVVSPEGKVLYQGAVSNRRDYAPTNQLYLKEALEEIKVGKAPRPSQRVSLGCVIPR